MDDDLVESIRRFSVSDDPLSTATAQTFVDAFAPLSHAYANGPSASSTSHDAASTANKLKQARSTALLTLASRSSSSSASSIPRVAKGGSTQPKVTDENLAQLLTPVIRSRLADTTPHSLLSALNFFSAILSVLPLEAHDILIADGIIDLVLEAPDAVNALNRSPNATSYEADSTAQLPSDRDLVSLAVAELFSSAANSAATRKYLAGQQAVLDWLDIASVPRNAHSTHIEGSKRRSEAIAVVAGLADIKVYRAIASEAVQGLTQSATSQPTSQQDHIRRIQEGRSERKRKDETLFHVAQGELVAQSEWNMSSASLTTDEVLLAEHRRTTQLSCLEVLAYLTVQPGFKERICSGDELLKALCTGLDSAALQQSQDVDSQRLDGAFQLGIANILSNVTAYPATLTSEEKEVRRLRKFANAQGAKQGGADEQEDEVLESIPRVEKRCTAVLEAKGVEALCAIAVAGPPASSTKQKGVANATSWKVNPSLSIRRACGEALLSLVTKQDRVMRGKAVQQGALKAVLALSAPVLHNLAANSTKRTDSQHDSSTSSRGLFSRSATSSGEGVTAEDLAPLQALAKLLISLNPSLLFPSKDGLLSVAPVMCSLLLCPSATRLHKFEALLALTNFASLSPEIGLRIASFSLEGSPVVEDKDGAQSGQFSNTSLIAQACEQLLMEDHTMVRRAWIELLVNLLQVEPVFNYFVSAGSLTSTGNSTDEPQDRLTLRLRMLLGLSEVDDWAQTKRSGSAMSSDGAGGEASYATRIACLAIMAMVTDVDSVVTAMLTLNRLFPILLGNLVLDRSEDAERNELERADLQPSNATLGNGEIETQVQLNGINLSLRAAYVLFNVLQYLQKVKGHLPKQGGGVDKDATQSVLQETLTYHVGQLKNGTDPAQVEEARKGLLQVLAECMKTLNQIEAA